MIVCHCTYSVPNLDMRSIFVASEIILLHFVYTYTTCHVVYYSCIYTANRLLKNILYAYVVEVL